MICASVPTTGPDSNRSNALPCGMSSTTSNSTTSAYPRSKMRCAVVAPTLPAPTTVTLNLMRCVSVQIGLKLGFVTVRLASDGETQPLTYWFQRCSKSGAPTVVAT